MTHHCLSMAAFMLERPNSIASGCFETSLSAVASHREEHPHSHNPSAVCRHPFVEGWDLGRCSSCGADLGAERRTEEEAHAERAQEDDSVGSGGAHAERLRGWGVAVSWLLAFTFDHDCWDWPTWRVVRDIIKPATAVNRCRYAQLDSVAAFTGDATVFISHCWGAAWGNLVAAASHGASPDRIVWIDIFAVRQWPGNAADLDFRGVISSCTATIVSVSLLPGLATAGFADLPAWLETDEGAAAKKNIAFFRLWCVVELAAAVQYSIPVIFKVGTVQHHGEGHVEYSTKEGELMLRNLADLIDCERAECFVQADYDREMAAIRAGVGVAAVNQMVTVAVKGAMAATAMTVLEVDAAVCGEPETLGCIPREGLVNAIKGTALFQSMPQSSAPQTATPHFHRISPRTCLRWRVPYSLT